MAPALGRASLFEHRWQRRAAVDQLWDHHPTDTAAVVERLAEPDDATSESERAIANVLTVLVWGRLFWFAIHARLTEQVRCQSPGAGYCEDVREAAVQRGSFFNEFSIPNCKL